MNSEAAITPRPIAEASQKTIVKPPEIKKPVEIKYSESKPSLTGVPQVDAELERASAVHQAREILNPKETGLERPKIRDLGKAVAFFVEPPIHLSGQAMIAQINEARKLGIIINSTEEGRKLVGYIDTPEKAAFLSGLGNLSLGLPGIDTSSFIHIDSKRGISIQGSLSIIAAARAFGLEQAGVGAAQITDKDDPEAVIGPKGAPLKFTPHFQIGYEKLPEDLPPETYAPIDINKVKTEHYSKIYAVKIDVNEFGASFEQATKNGQIALDQDLILFFNKIDNQLKELGVLQGEQTTDSLTFYFPNLFTKRAVEKILAEVKKTSNYSFKATGLVLEDVELTNYNGRVIHSDKAVPESIWARKEKDYKRAISHLPKEQKKKAETLILFKHSKRSEQLGFQKAA